MPGPSQADVKTIKANLNSRLQGIVLNNLPKTFQDAIHLCVKLGVEFLWIDALCIVQDDDQDWETEASKMGKYYRNAYITIAAHPSHTETGTLDPDADRGCHLIRPPEFKTTIGGRNDQPFVISSYLVLHDLFFATPRHNSHNSYFMRGWCFQERILAPRILHFTRSEVMLECNAAKLECECGQINIKKDLRGSETARPSLIEGSDAASLKPLLMELLEEGRRFPDYQHVTLKGFQHLIEDYTDKDFTQSTDLLPALSGVASLLTPVLGRYYAGIWEHDLHWCLEWRSIWTADITPHRHPTGKYVAPSFSWASRFGPVSDAGSGGLLEPWDRAEILKIQCQPLNPSAPFGEVVDGSLTLLAGSLSVTLHAEQTSSGLVMRISWATIKTHEETFALDAVEDQFLAEKTPIICIELRQREWTHYRHNQQLLISVRAIVAVPSDRRPGAFRRIGLARYKRPAMDLPMSEFVIV